MALKYVVKARARREVERLAEWWSVNRTAAPGQVRLDVEGVLFVITQHPRLGHKVENGRSVEVRRYLMSGPINVNHPARTTFRERKHEYLPESPMR